MPGLGNGNDTEITPGRKTHIVYDVDDPIIVEHGYGLIKSAKDIVSSGGALEGAVYHPGAGIQLAEDMAAIRTMFWGVASDEGVLTATDAFIPPGFVQRYLNRTKPEVDGAFTGTLLPAVSGIAFVKRKSASGSYSDAATFRLAADQAAFPGPTIEGNDLVMDRVMASKAAHVQNQPLAFLITIFGDTGQKGLLIGVAYFNGPAGTTRDFEGTGQYAAAIFDNGEIQLFERGKVLPVTDPPPDPLYTWKRRSTMKFPNPDRGANMNFLFLVRSVVLRPGEAAQGNRHPRIIEFKLSEWAVDDIGGTAAPQLVLLTNAAMAMAGIQTVNQYEVPSDTSEPPPTTPASIRLDLPRPFKSLFRVKRMNLRTSAYVRGVPFSLTQGGFAWGETLRIEYYFDQQTGTNVTLQIKGADGVNITPDRTGTIATTGQAGIWHEYDFPTDYAGRTWLADFHLTGGGTASPTLNSMRVVKRPAFSTYEGSNTEGGIIKKGSLSIIDGGSDPSLSSAGWQVADTHAELDLLGWSSSLPVKIETEYDPDDDTKRVVLFRGYIEDADGTRRRKRANAGLARTGAAHHTPVAYDYEISSIGRWLRIQETRDTTMFSFMQDPNAGLDVPYRVTEALRILLRRCGFDSDRVDIPDQDVRLFPVRGANEDVYVIKPLSDISQAIEYLARDYLGAALVDDENAGDHGKWKLINPPKAPYTNVAYFTTATQPSGRVFKLDSYEATELAAGDIGGIAHEESTAVTIPIIRLKRGMKRPMANKLTVSGVGYIESTPVHQLVCTMVNPDSYRHHPDSVAGPSASNPDWLGREVPLWYVDPMLQTSSAVAFVASRLYSILCLGYRLFRVYAPLAFVDHEEGAGKMRKLRFGDPVVLYDGQQEWQCVVRSCTPEIHSDGRQMATYEIQQVRF